MLAERLASPLTAVEPRGLTRQPEGEGAPKYFAVIYTDVWAPHDPADWAKEVSLAAALAEENPGYEGYRVDTMESGREYAVTYWKRPEYLRQWKDALALLAHNRGLQNDMFGEEGCEWPWLKKI